MDMLRTLGFSKVGFYSNYEAFFSRDLDLVWMSSYDPTSPSTTYEIYMVGGILAESVVARWFIACKEINETASTNRRDSNIHVMMEAPHGLVEHSVPESRVSKGFNSLHYGDHVQAAYRKIREDILDGESGIHLLHGEPGTGKTSFIRELAYSLPEKKFLFVPPGMAGILASPSLLSFLIQRTGRILIVEDAEEALMSRKSGGNSAVSNLLNMGDGIMGDLLNMHVICTLNADIGKIDPAITRSGRMRNLIEFPRLSITDSQELMDSLGTDRIVTEPMTLAEIYNLPIEANFERRKVGFH